MDRSEILEYAAFTTDPAGGNPAGVVLDASGLADDEMLAIAAELAHSETAFLTGPADGGEDGRSYRVRYFAPQVEVPFCGHATVATAVALAERIGPGELLFSTASGPVPVKVQSGPDGVLRATLTSVGPYLELIDDEDVDAFLEILGWRQDELDPALPPRIAYAGARHLVFAARSRGRLADLGYDFDELADLMREHDLITLQLVWREDDLTFVVRNPFPVGGVVEDPATGAAALAFGAYLRDLGLASGDARIVLRQGEDLGRPSLLEVELHPGDERVRVTGAAVQMTIEG